MPRITAAVIGATGLIGRHLVAQLQQDSDFETIRLLVRRPVGQDHPKAEPRLVNFQDEESFKLAVDGCDVVFCAVGTTRKKVKGDREAYRKVDYDIPVQAARYCAETGGRRFLLVSSVGADSKSRNFYLQLKGEVEEAVQQFTIDTIAIFRPSLLLGERAEFRPGEKIGQLIMPLLSFLFAGRLARYKPIPAREVAAAMIRAAKKDNKGYHVYEYAAMKELLHH